MSRLARSGAEHRRPDVTERGTTTDHATPRVRPRVRCNALRAYFDGLLTSGLRGPTNPQLQLLAREATVNRHMPQWLVGIMAAALLLLATSASARNVSTSEQNVRATFTSLEFAAGTTIRCRITLEGSFHARTIAKVVGSLMGAVTRAIVAHPCTNGEAWADNGTESEPLGTAPNRIPYHLTYESFTGTLPNVTAITGAISRFSFVIQTSIFGLTCRGRYGRLEDSVSGTAAREAGGGITSFTPSGRASLVEQLGPSAVCPSTGTFSGTGTATALSNGARLTITLI
jgi:hypothetical protein